MYLIIAMYISVFILAVDVNHQQCVRPHQLLLADSVVIGGRLRGGHAVAAAVATGPAQTYQSQPARTSGFSCRHWVFSYNSGYLQT